MDTKSKGSNVNELKLIIIAIGRDAFFSNKKTTEAKKQDARIFLIIFDSKIPKDTPNNAIWSWPRDDVYQR